MNREPLLFHVMIRQGITRRLMNREPLLFHVMIRQGITWFTLDTEIPEIV